MTAELAWAPVMLGPVIQLPLRSIPGPDQPVSPPDAVATDSARLPERPPVSLEQVARLLRGLDSAQRRAVTHGEGPLRVMAGPGTGKTRVITTRVAWLIAAGRARPDEILALTFTDKAADEMQARVDELVPYGYADVAVHTFHAFGDRLVREHALELGLSREPRVVSPVETVAFLRERVAELGLGLHRPAGDPSRLLASLVELFGRAKDQGITAARFRAAAAGSLAEASRAAAGDDPDDGAARLEVALREVELADAFGRYQAMLEAAGLIDFADQVALARRLLASRPDVREGLRGRYRYVLVDEFQDTNAAQLELLELIVPHSASLTVVGDDEQSIYGFRGAARENLREFERAFPHARTIVLRANYRSRAAIVAAANRLIGHNALPDERPPRAAAVARRRARSRPVVARGFETADAEADWIAGEIAERVRAGRSPGDVAVLVRTNRDAGPVLRSLAMAGLRWHFSGAAGLFARAEVRELLAFLRVVADPDSTLDLYALATAEPYRLGGLDLTALLEAARRRHRSLWQVLLELQEQPGLLRVQPATRRTVQRLLQEVRASIELSHRRPAGEVLYEHLRRSGRLARLAAAGPSADEALQVVARFFTMIREQSALLVEDRVAGLVPHLEALAEAGDEPLPDDGPLVDRDAVAVLTVHKAKGLEFPVVFVAGLADGRFPSHGRPERLRLPAQLESRTTPGMPTAGVPDEEERRLAYVAMTRARDELILTWANSGGRRRLRPSPFVAEALDLAPGEPAGEGGPDQALTVLRAIGQAPADLASPSRASRPRSDPLTVSFSQLDSYLTCPLQYRLRYVVGLPTPPHHALVYGSALHAAVAAYHASERRGSPLGETALLEAFAAHWQPEGFLSQAHEAARYAAGQAALRRFREERLARGEPPPSAVESAFTVPLGGARLRGRYDRIDATPEGAIITDYKSSDVRTPARARERARDSLQLAVYALAYEAQTGRLPVAVQLHFLESGLVGRVAPETSRLERARARLDRALDGIREERFTATPDLMACSTCPFRRICPDRAA
ncbi:MAG TPA: ATP-dependent DNA helicase [Candidatus Dormibacteraeota bacterium]|nr:ATP-dependent DNA helicase [Candidatus Dormibacteraeota bacterium]